MDEANLIDWIRDIQQVLIAFDHVDLGYETGQNYISLFDRKSPQSDYFSLFPKDMQVFYSHVQKIDLTDIFNSYFLLGISEMQEQAQKKWLPTQIEGEDYAGQIVSFGSTGGGDVFTLHLATSHVLLLTSDGLIGETYDSDEFKFNYLADSFDQFLYKLLEDVKAFVYNKPNWRYMAYFYHNSENDN